MGNYFEPVLSEEQLAAYLDGMLTTEESNMVENLIASSPDMVEIMDDLDAVDSSYIYEVDEEVPIECMADDFSLPIVDDNYGAHDESDANDMQIFDDYEYDGTQSDPEHEYNHTDDSYYDNGADDLFDDQGFDDAF